MSSVHTTTAIRPSYQYQVEQQWSKAVDLAASGSADAPATQRTLSTANGPVMVAAKKVSLQALARGVRLQDLNSPAAALFPGQLADSLADASANAAVCSMVLHATTPHKTGGASRRVSAQQGHIVGSRAVEVEVAAIDGNKVSQIAPASRRSRCR